MKTSLSRNTSTKTVEVHPAAIVDESVELADGVVIGPYCVLGPRVTLGKDTKLQSHVVIGSDTRLGERNQVYSYASIGQQPQDKKYKVNDHSVLEIGDDNSLREFVTINRGSVQGGGITSIGDKNWIMAYCHVAHDCKIGNNVVMANGATLGGHVQVGDGSYLGGYTAVHQFCSIGRLVMTGGHTMVAQDVTPFVIAVGNRARLYGLNRVGLERAGFSSETIQELQDVYKLFFKGKLKACDSLLKIETNFSKSQHVQDFVRFIRQSKRGICR